MGFLKGRFHSLKSLRVNINSSQRHIFATYWVSACIGLHSFALKCEADEREKAGNATSVEDHPFIQEGLESDSDSLDSSGDGIALDQGASRNPRLRAGRAFREKLKRRYFRAQERRSR